MKLKLSAILFASIFSLILSAQDPNTNPKPEKGKVTGSKTKPDSAISSFSLSLNYAVQIPGGDLRWRYGPNSSIGGSCFYKTKKNVFFGAQWNYLFGKKLYGENPLDSIMTSDGFVIDKEGKYADIRMFERGFTLGFSAGKVFNSFLSPNKNSGFLLTGGIGYLQHKIKIYDNGSRSPQLSKEYLKGYDRLTSGFTTTQFVGYWYMSKNRFVNFYGGVEFIQGFTKSRRSWDYNLMRADTENRIDLLSGIRIGWVIPLYKRTSQNTYYY